VSAFNGMVDAFLTDLLKLQQLAADLESIVQARRKNGSAF
jgi:hypothetical protein